MWRIWAKSLGRKDGLTDSEADAVAIVRTLVFVTYLVTNCFIVAGVIRHWNDVDSTAPMTYNHSEPRISQ